MSGEEKKRLSKVFRVIIIVLMGLTVTLTILSGAGTICVALGAEKYESMSALVPYKPLYQLLTVISIATGIWGIFVTVSFVRGRISAYRNALLFLIIGGVSAGVQMAVSQAVRGNSAPVNIRFYVTAFTLLIFVFLRLTSLRDITEASGSIVKGSSAKVSAGIALIMCSIATFTTHLWVGATHTAQEGYSWVNLFANHINTAGWGMMLSGVSLFISSIYSLSKKTGMQKSKNDLNEIRRRRIVIQKI